jgi:hypothetical protein
MPPFFVTPRNSELTMQTLPWLSDWRFSIGIIPLISDPASKFRC